MDTAATRSLLCNWCGCRWVSVGRGKLTFGFSLVCSERCRFEFASSGRVMGEFFAGDADDKEYSLPQGNYTFTWTFTTHRSGDMPSNDHATIWVCGTYRC